MSDIIIGEWLYDEKKEPELAKQDQHRPKKPRRERGKQGQQLIVSRELLKSGHTALRGRTGSGKTARGFLPLILQVMQEYTLYWALANGMGESHRERDAIVVIDLAGDKPMFHAVRKMAKKLGRKFGQLALDPTKSQPFDMFQTVGIDGNRLIRICNLLLEAFSLDHGLIYGGSWYSQRNLLLLLEVARHLVSIKESGASITLEDVDRYLSSPQCPNVKDAEQIRGIFRFLLEYQQLVGHADDEAIDLRRAIEDGEVIYAFLPAIAEATTARQIAGLLLQTTIAMAMKIYDEREGDPRPQRHVHIFVDEFPIIAGSSYEALLTGARKFGVSLYMAYQTTESLQKDKATNLAAPVRDNTVLKMLFTVTGDQDIKELQAFSGETTRTTRSTPIGGSVTLQGRGAFGSGSVSEAVTPVSIKTRDPRHLRT